MAAMSALAEKEETQVGATQQLLSQDKKRSTWPSLGQWVSCICVVTFDLELGQAIEVQRELPTPHTHTPVRPANVYTHLMVHPNSVPFLGEVF